MDFQQLCVSTSGANWTLQTLSPMTDMATMVDNCGHQSEIGRFKETKYIFGSLQAGYYQEKKKTRVMVIPSP